MFEADIVVLLDVEVSLCNKFLLLSSVERVAMLVNGEGY